MATVTPVSCSTDYDDLYARIATLTAENARLTAERDVARAEAARVKADLGKCQGRIARINGILANKDLDAGDKVTLIGVETDYRAHARLNGQEADPEPGQAPEPVPVFLGRIAARTGSSEQSVSTRLQRLQKAGAVRMELHKTRGASGQPISRLYVAPTFAPVRTIAFQPEERPQRGGKRVRVCEACGSRNLTTLTICAECGVHQNDEHPVYTELTPELEIIPTPPPPTPEPEQSSQPQETLNSTPGCQTDSAGETTTSECDHPAHMQRKIRGVWTCGQCGANGRQLIEVREAQMGGKAG